MKYLLAFLLTALNLSAANIIYNLNDFKLSGSVSNVYVRMTPTESRMVGNTIVLPIPVLYRTAQDGTLVVNFVTEGDYRVEVLRPYSTSPAFATFTISVPAGDSIVYASTIANLKGTSYTMAQAEARFALKSDIVPGGGGGSTNGSSTNSLNALNPVFSTSMTLTGGVFTSYGLTALAGQTNWLFRVNDSNGVPMLLVSTNGNVYIGNTLAYSLTSVPVYSLGTNFIADLNISEGVIYAANTVNFAASTNRPASANTVLYSSYTIEAGASLRVLGFPVGWKWQGTTNNPPTSLAANKTGILSLKCYGPAEANVLAAFSAQP